jgi:hypothetical protein
VLELELEQEQRDRGETAAREEAVEAQAQLLAAQAEAARLLRTTETCAQQTQTPPQLPQDQEAQTAQEVQAQLRPAPQPDD